MLVGILFTVVLLIMAFICLGISIYKIDGNEIFIPLLFVASIFLGGLSIYTNSSLQRADVKDDVITYLVETGKLDMHIVKNNLGQDKIYYYVNDSTLVKLSDYLTDDALVRKIEMDNEK